MKCFFYFIAGNKPENYRELDTQVKSNVKVIDGALVLKNVQKASEGYYLCKATNGIGRGLSAVIYISIQGESITFKSQDMGHLLSNSLFSAACI